MPKRTTAVSKIILTIGEKEISLTPEEVKDLKEALDKMYPALQYHPPVIIRDHHYPKPLLWWQSPYTPYSYSANGHVSLKAEGFDNRLPDGQATMRGNAYSDAVAQPRA